jgi:hypothetical protein
MGTTKVNYPAEYYLIKQKSKPWGLLFCDFAE